MELKNKKLASALSMEKKKSYRKDSMQLPLINHDYAFGYYSSNNSMVVGLLWTVKFYLSGFNAKLSSSVLVNYVQITSLSLSSLEQGRNSVVPGSHAISKEKDWLKISSD